MSLCIIRSYYIHLRWPQHWGHYTLFWRRFCIRRTCTIYNISCTPSYGYTMNTLSWLGLVCTNSQPSRVRFVFIVFLRESSSLQPRNDVRIIVMGVVICILMQINYFKLNASLLWELNEMKSRAYNIYIGMCNYIHKAAVLLYAHSRSSWLQ